MLKVYQWEEKTFPWQQKVNITPNLRREVTLRLAASLGIKVIEVETTLRGRDRGRAWPSVRRIALPTRLHNCSLGIILHELAHLWNYQLHQNRGHRLTWKRTLIKTYVESRKYLKPTLLEAKEVANGN